MNINKNRILKHLFFVLISNPRNTKKLLVKYTLVKNKKTPNYTLFTLVECKEPYNIRTSWKKQKKKTSDSTKKKHEKKKKEVGLEIQIEKEIRMAERTYGELDELSEREMVTDYFEMNGIEKFKITDKDMDLLRALAKYGILYSEDASEILKENSRGKRRVRLKSLGIIDGKRGIVYLSALSREAFLEMNIEPHKVKESDKTTEAYSNELANRYRRETKKGK